MNDWKSVLIDPSISLRTAMERIDKAGSQLVLVVDPQKRLLGTLSDGDVRRALLSGASMSDSVGHIMHTDPSYVKSSDAPEVILSKMRNTGLHQLPILKSNREVVGLALINDYIKFSKRDNWVVIMAGGLGSRLGELTKDTPKPMLTVGSRPLLETILLNFIEQGFHQFYIAVNYKAEKIQNYFGNGKKYGVNIKYIQEEQRMGTAGALSLLPEYPNLPFVVSNADLLNKEDFGLILDQHTISNAQATMVIREYEMQIPFGVVNVINNEVISIIEKPVHKYLVNAGMYVLSPEILKLMPINTFFDMPQLFELILNKKYKVIPYRIDGYWVDIGRASDLEKANFEYKNIFN